MMALVRSIDRLSGLSGVVIAWVVFPLILASCFEVFSRYALNAPTIWAFELGYMAMGTHALIGAAYTLREGGHIRIDVLYSRFPDKAKAVVDTGGYLLLFLPGGLLGELGPLGLLGRSLCRQPSFGTIRLEPGDLAVSSGFLPRLFPARIAGLWPNSSDASAS